MPIGSMSQYVVDSGPHQLDSGGGAVPRDHSDLAEAVGLAQRLDGSRSLVVERHQAVELVEIGQEVRRFLLAAGAASWCSCSEGLPGLTVTSPAALSRA